jgi:hypothetical protein
VKDPEKSALRLQLFTVISWPAGWPGSTRERRRVVQSLCVVTEIYFVHVCETEFPLASDLATKEYAELLSAHMTDSDGGGEVRR